MSLTPEQISNINQQTAFPPDFINAYINAQLSDPDYGIVTSSQWLVPILPATGTTNIEDIYNDDVSIVNQSNALVILYDRLIRFRPNRFYRQKREQLVYFLYSTDLDSLFGGLRIISDALDREDAAAQDVNLWLSQNPIQGKPLNIFFHNFKVYQADESRDVMELASGRTVYMNKLIIEYDYHTKDSANPKYT